jgi:ankyrin repeat protein
MRPTDDAAAYTALHLAALLGHQGVARVLIEHGADVNALDTVRDHGVC